jgi:hypothetical protein
MEMRKWEKRQTFWEDPKKEAPKSKKARTRKLSDLCLLLPGRTSELPVVLQLLGSAMLRSWFRIGGRK